MPSDDDVGNPPPGSFRSELGDWNDWLLVHGLPELPDVVGEGETVPVAVWVGSEWAATLHLSYCDADEDDPDDTPSLDTEEQAFRRVGEGWEAAGGSGGTNWSPGLTLEPASLGPSLREVEVPHDVNLLRPPCWAPTGPVAQIDPRRLLNQCSSILAMLRKSLVLTAV